MKRDPTETCVEVLTSALPDPLPSPDTSGGLLLVEVDDASAVSHLFREILFYFYRRFLSCHVGDFYVHVGQVQLC